MYICICNAITDRDVRAAAADGASRPLDVYAACRCRAQCGTCTRTILAMLRTMLPAPADADITAAGAGD